jgi:hypothetical protein
MASKRVSRDTQGGPVLVLWYFSATLAYCGLVSASCMNASKA